MIVGVPREIKQDEYRVAMLPVGVEELTRAGHRVLVERGAGLGSGISDDNTARTGPRSSTQAADVFSQADLIVKVKEPQPQEFPLFRRGQVLFTYLHFAASEALTRSVLETGRDGGGLRNAARQAGRSALPHPHERSRRPHEHPGRGQVPRATAGGPRHPAGRRPRRAAGAHRDSRRTAWSARTPPGSPPGSRPTSSSSTSTSIACGISTTSCRPT